MPPRQDLRVRAVQHVIGAIHTRPSWGDVRSAGPIRAGPLDALALPFLGAGHDISSFQELRGKLRRRDAPDRYGVQYQQSRPAFDTEFDRLLASAANVISVSPCDLLRRPQP
jgi:hypothetical protein